MMWNPNLDKAPHDGTKIDLWVVETWQGKSVGVRATGCWWGKPDDQRDCRTGTNRALPPQWCESGDRYGDYCVDPVEWSERLITHWMPVPEPPA